MKKFKINLKMTLKLLLVFISVVVVIVLGVLFNNKIPGKNIFLAITIILLILNIVSNIIINRKDLSKIKNKKSGEELLGLLLKTKEEALKDPEAIRLNILKKYNKIRLYSYLTLILMYILLFLYPYPSVLPHAIILIVFVYFFNIFNSKRKEELGSKEFFDNVILSKEKYQEIYDITDKVFSYHNINKEHKISYTYNSQLSITENDDVIVIVIGYFVLRLLTKKELEAALHHEIAHVINKDTDYSLKFSKLSSSIKYLSNSIFFIIFYTNIYSLTFETELLNYLSTIFYERKADSVINQVGCNEDFINGLSKIYIYDLYYNHQYLENISLGRFEEVNYNILDDDYSNFIRYYNNNLDFLNNFLEKSIAGRFDTHPSIAERKNNLNVEKINVSFENNEFKTSTDLIQEKFIKDGKVEIENQYKVLRKEYLKALNDYENINENTSQEELISICLDLFRVTLYEKALIVCDKILAINNQQSRAIFIKGAILINLYHNEEGASYLFRIIEEGHGEYISDSLQIIGHFYASKGDEEGIQRLRNIQTQSFDNDMDYEELSKILPSDKLENVTNDEGIEMVKRIVSDSKVESLVVAKKTLNNKSMIHVILIFDEFEKEEVVDEINNNVWRTLDAINGIDYYLHTLSNKYYKNLKWLHKFEIYQKNK